MKKRFLLLGIALVFVLSGTIAAQNEKVEQAIRKLDEQRIAALTQPDIPVLERMMTDDFTYTHSSGQVQTKAEFLGDFKSGKRVFKSLKQEDVQVRVYENVAIVTGRCTLLGVNGGKDFELPMRFIEVYTSNHGNWQWATWQSTRLAS
jgi:ketosteroid isomerase-like protein